MNEYNPQGISANQDDIFPNQDDDSKYVAGSPLEQLEVELRAETEEEPYRWHIPRRPKLRIIINPNIDGEKFQIWQRQSRVGKKTGTEQIIDPLKLAALMVGNQLVGVEVKQANGEWVEATENDRSLTLGSPSLRKMLAGKDQVSSGGVVLVRNLFGNDGHLLAASAELANAAGYGDEDLGEVGTDGDPLDLS